MIMCSSMQRLSLRVDGTSLPGKEINEQEGKTQIAPFVCVEGGFDCSLDETLNVCLLNYDLKSAKQNYWPS